ncbi:MAG: DNA repair protein RecO [Selenomonas sp.]|uniref:DNA repair protein RecO n=1 Tax=Selenomonas sp. TaxID=2053611 RepID=UPI0025E26E4B|nr:DNA repair protein RecO [Selenomonas sp.]MCR5757675.1 DNA repair protein RecO [Selenomonas sp.]
MASYQTAAVILGSKNWGEADKMVTLFTYDRGLVEAAAFGCRRPRSPLAAGMQMFSSIEVQLTEGKRLDTVRQCTLKHHYKRLTEDLETMAYGSFVAEFLREFLPPGQAEPQMFARLLYILDSFEVRNPRVTALIAVIQLLEFTGMQLHFEHCVRCGQVVAGDAHFSTTAGGVLCGDCREPGSEPFADELRRFILSLRDYDWEKPPVLKVTGSLLMQAESLFLNYLQSLLGKPLKSLAFIQQL